MSLPSTVTSLQLNCYRPSYYVITALDHPRYFISPEPAAIRPEIIDEWGPQSASFGISDGNLSPEGSPSLSLLLSSASSPSPKAGGITLAIDLFNAALCRPDVIKSNHQFNIFADELPRRLVSPAPSCNCCLRFPERIANLIAINKE